MVNEKKIVEKLLQLSKKAYKRKEVPVSAILIHNNSIIAADYNRREHKKQVTAHAEFLAIHKASRKLKRWNLSDCNLYVTLKPCSMCMEVIKQSRIKNVYYLLDKPDFKHEYSKTDFFKLPLENEKQTYQQLLTSFFRNMR